VHVFSRILYFRVVLVFSGVPFFQKSMFFKKMGLFQKVVTVEGSVALCRTHEGRIGADYGRFDREILDRLLSLSEYCVLRVEEMLTSSSVLGV
jgi:hypothetical protein